MWKEGYYVKELINTYLSSVKKAEEQDQSEIRKWPSWEMNNHEQVVEGKLLRNSESWSILYYVIYIFPISSIQNHFSFQGSNMVEYLMIYTMWS